MRLISKLDRYLENKEYELIIKNNSIDIINYQEILDFNITKISVRCENAIINIEGKNLTISKMLDDEILITGRIINVRIN